MKWFNWFKKDKKEKEKKEQIIAIKPVEFLGSSSKIRILNSYKYVGFASIIVNDEYCFIVTYPHFPPCDMTLYINNTDYSLVLIGIYKDCELINSDGTKSWWNLPIIKLIKSDENINYDSEYSYDLLKKVFDKNIEILKYEEI
jgi:hypothetical protein